MLRYNVLRMFIMTFGPYRFWLLLNFCSFFCRLKRIYANIPVFSLYILQNFPSSQSISTVSFGRQVSPAAGRNAKRLNLFNRGNFPSPNPPGSIVLMDKKRRSKEGAESGARFFKSFPLGAPSYTVTGPAVLKIFLASWTTNVKLNFSSLVELLNDFTRISKFWRVI